MAAPEVQQLLDMGFSEDHARWALSQGNNNVEQAVNLLVSGQVGSLDPPPQPPVIDNREQEFNAPPSAQDAPRFGNDLQPINTTPVYEERPEPRGLDDQEGHQKFMDWRKKEDHDLNTALEMSIRESQGGDTRAAGSAFIGGTPLVELPESAILALEAAALERDLPCGLRNIGNTCYVNSFLQTLLNIDAFRDRILRFRNPANPAEQLISSGSAAGFAGAPIASEPEAEHAVVGATSSADPSREAANASRREHCIMLAAELRHLFAYGLFTQRNCIDPTRLLGELVDDKGQKLAIGSQEDVGEFMLKFLERLDEGLGAGTFIGDSDCGPAAGVAPVLDADSSTVASEAPVQENSQDAGAVATASPSAATADSGDSGSTPLQSLCIGRQVQVFSYRDVPGGAAQAEKAAEVKPETSEDVLPQPPADASMAVPPEVPPPALPQADEVVADVQRPMVGSATSPSSEQGSLVVSEEKSDFLQIFLDVKYKDLYSAWEAANRTQVDYITPSGSSTEASTNTYIERLPQLLTFQLQRVIFDKEKTAQVKVDEAFNFDLTLYVDRFLHSNRTAAQEAAVQVRELQERREGLQKALLRFREYEGRQGLGIADVLALATDCLESNVSSSSAAASATAVANETQLELFDPRSVSAAGAPQAVAVLDELRQTGPSAVQLLRTLRATCLSQEELLTAEIDRIDGAADDAYRDLRQVPYELHAIWVHQGNAGSGHYWAYVRDWRSNRWVHYDDALVSVVTWEEVRTAAVGQAGSNTSAYVLVYVDKELALTQSQPRDQVQMLKGAEAVLPRQLLAEINNDNGKLDEERIRQEEHMAEQELRHHAEAIFQHYAGLIHKWEPQKETGKKSGNPHDPNNRKTLYDSALLSFDLCLFRLHGETTVWAHLVLQSVDAQRQVRGWKPEEEGRILFHLRQTMNHCTCDSSMIQNCSEVTKTPQCELVPMEFEKHRANYDLILLQAHLVDEALQALKDNCGHLMKTIGALAFVWANWKLEEDDKFRQNEVLLIMSTLIYNTISILQKKRSEQKLTEAALQLFLPNCEYFLLLLIAVEWPNNWKQPLITRIQGLFPQLNQANGTIVFFREPKEGGVQEQVDMKIARFMDSSATIEFRKEFILTHPLTQAHDRLNTGAHPEAGQDFFNRHRLLYSWLMNGDEAISQQYVTSIAPLSRSPGDFVEESD